MKTNLTFSPRGWSDYLYWQSEDRKTLKRINRIIEDILRGGMAGGIAKPEPLRHCKAWSRRIDEKNRILYADSGDGNFIILACRGHYGD